MWRVEDEAQLNSPSLVKTNGLRRPGSVPGPIFSVGGVWQLHAALQNIRVEREHEMSVLSTVHYTFTKSCSF